MLREEPREPVLDDAAPEPAAGEDADLPALRTPRRPAARLDALIDALAPMSVEAPVSGDVAAGHLPPTRRVGTKIFMIEGRCADTGEWEVPAAGARYAELQDGVQLANRTGALKEIEYSEFVQRV